jgi:hypothetical protein
MKKLILSLFAFLLVFSLSSCKKDNMAYTNAYNKSYNAWEDFKAASNNSYRYNVQTSSWAGTSSETVITVQKGVVVGRDYIRTFSTHTASSWQVDTLGAWSENGAQLGTHDEGASLWTLDDIYTEAKTNWLLKRDDAQTFFETENNGMISSCGYRNNGCQDDCFIGIHIKTITPL